MRSWVSPHQPHPLPPCNVALPAEHRALWAGEGTLPARALSSPQLAICLPRVLRLLSPEYLSQPQLHLTKIPLPPSSQAANTRSGGEQLLVWEGAAHPSGDEMRAVAAVPWPPGSSCRNLCSNVTL